MSIEQQCNYYTKAMLEILLSEFEGLDELKTRKLLITVTVFVVSKVQR